MAGMGKARDGRRTPERPDGRAGTIHAEDVLRAQELLAELDHEGLADLFDVLSDPTRVRIIHILLSQEMCTSDLAATLHLADPAVSQHLRVLRNLRIATPRRAGRIVYYSVRSRAIARLMTHGRRALDEPAGRGEAERHDRVSRSRSA
jgi:ArsR family transcriptional regulator, lead/cadmium/zinc/bismuth-responsive transcriptional repressor